MAHFLKKTSKERSIFKQILWSNHRYLNFMVQRTFLSWDILRISNDQCTFLLGKDSNLLPHNKESNMWSQVIPFKQGLFGFDPSMSYTSIKINH